MDTDSFEKLTNGIKNIIFSIGLICAGLWAVYEFSVKHYESLDLQISASKIGQENKKYLIAVKLKIRNDGNRSINIGLNEKSIIATKIKFDEIGKIKRTGKTISTAMYTFRDSTGEEMRWLKSLEVSPNSDRELEYILAIKEPGTYLIELNSLYKSTRYWAANTYFVVAQ